MSLLLLDRFCPASSKEKGSGELLCYDAVTRYGPRTSCQRERLNRTLDLRVEIKFQMPFERLLPMLRRFLRGDAS